MKVSIAVRKTAEVDAMPETCAACPFAELCDDLLFRLSKADGTWTKAAQTRRHGKCPLTIERGV